ncbi:MAG TPA: ABC transporter substrate-binding protein [Devosiaceae bacterium]|nr:ABC transporter substrate-binding protein [Devosiaceae bacterium]
MISRALLTGAAATALLLALAGGAAADPKQGGTMTVTYKDDVSTLDPAIGYDWQNWSMIKSLYSRLMDYKPGTTELTPDLATSYDVSSDGLTYTFHLRKGVKFHNGREMTADDVAYSFNRSVNPKTQSPGAAFFHSIAGYDDVAGGKADAMSGIKVVDPQTISITLSKPDATFLQVVALNFASVVAKEDVEKWGTDYGHHPDGTGAFYLDNWTLGQQVTFKRNPDYYVTGTPYLDEIDFKIGAEPLTALLQLQKGEVDVVGDGIPPAKFLEVMNDPEQKKLVVNAPQLETSYLTMKTTMKPLDDVRVRRAINMAINKDRIVKIINGRADIANQPLPPGMPGYDKDFKGYPYDPDGAKKLLADAKYDTNQSLDLLVYNTDPNPRIAQAIQQDLAAVGIKVDIKSLDQSVIIAAGGEPDQAPLIWSGGMGWIADFPDPSDFYGPILGCGSAVKGGWNWALYCNKEIDAMAAKADAMVAPDQAEARADLWKQIFDKIMTDDAPWVPVFNEERYTIHTARIGGDPSLFVDPVHIPINNNAVYATDAQ